MPENPHDKPATKTDLDALAKRLESQLDSRLADSESRLLDKVQELIRDAQTEILRGFERYASGENVRMRKLEADFSNLNTSETTRMALIEDRLTALEIRVMRGGK